MNAPSDIAGKSHFGVAPVVVAKLRRTFERTPGLMRVWIFGSRARGDHRPESDIDLAVDAPDLSAQAFSRLNAAIEDLGLIYRVDVVRLQDDLDPAFRENIERDRQRFWAPQTYIADIEEIGSTELKPFQRDALEGLRATWMNSPSTASRQNGLPRPCAQRTSWFRRSYPTTRGERGTACERRGGCRPALPIARIRAVSTARNDRYRTCA